MTKRTTKAEKPNNGWPEAWLVVNELTLDDGTVIEYGDVVHIAGTNRGEFRGQEFTFCQLVWNTGIEKDNVWVTCYGGDKDPKGRRQYASFVPERVTKRIRTREQQEEINRRRREKE